jgi:hypothetical protein
MMLILPSGDREGSVEEFLVEEFLVEEFLVEEFLVEEFLVEEFLVEEFLVEGFRKLGVESQNGEGFKNIHEHNRSLILPSGDREGF